ADQECEPEEEREDGERVGGLGHGRQGRAANAFPLSRSRGRVPPRRSPNEDGRGRIIANAGVRKALLSRLHGASKTRVNALMATLSATRSPFRGARGGVRGAAAMAGAASGGENASVAQSYY